MGRWAEVIGYKARAYDLPGYGDGPAGAIAA
jgi:hypothetical protein